MINRLQKTRPDQDRLKNKRARAIFIFFAYDVTSVTSGRALSAEIALFSDKAPIVLYTIAKVRASIAVLARNSAPKRKKKSFRLQYMLLTSSDAYKK